MANPEMMAFIVDESQTVTRSRGQANGRFAMSTDIGSADGSDE